MQRRPISAVMSVPRLGFMDNFMCAQAALYPLGIEVSKVTGAFWGQCLTRIIQQIIKDRNPEWIMTVDYDTMFTQKDIEQLVRLTTAYPDIDAIVPMQMHRTENRPLLSLPLVEGEIVPQVPVTLFWQELTKLQTGHMGCMMLKADKLQKLTKPWFHSRPDANGDWEEGREDDDTYFWLNWWNAGNTLYQANRVPVGHAELMIRWPDKDIRAIHQHPNDFWKNGKPEDVWT